MAVPSSEVPSWPSLYNPGIELLNIEHRDPIQPRGHYLAHSGDIFRFTLYWTLVFYTPVFLLCGLYAFLNLTFPPTHRKRRSRMASENSGLGLGAFPLSPMSPRSPYIRSTPASPRNSVIPVKRKEVSNNSETPLLQPGPSLPARPNRVRSRTAFALLVLLAFLLFSLTGAVLSAAIVGFGVAGLYSAAGYAVSTWVPFLWSLISALVGLLSIWPSVIDII
ncbi:hypothetical protein MKEN_00851300 [Mycena kentingensis (nom. inval.)]|nr:hypothetical protein MKEN_00851300 [Mycena kentingensis (nom. inval.)]